MDSVLDASRHFCPLCPVIHGMWFFLYATELELDTTMRIILSLFHLTYCVFHPLIPACSHSPAPPADGWSSITCGRSELFLGVMIHIRWYFVIHFISHWSEFLLVFTSRLHFMDYLCMCVILITGRDFLFRSWELLVVGSLSVSLL